MKLNTTKTLTKELRKKLETKKKNDQIKKLLYMKKNRIGD